MIEASISPAERRAAGALALIFAFRMIGLFMVLPVLALYAEHLEGVTPLLVGLALGIYGLTQAALQIPFGMLSDRIGRRPVITAGLLIFALGSIVAAMADTIHGVVLGRALQGGGAVAAAVMALAADLTREEHRTKAMAIIGMSIGMSFVVAMVAGPVLNGWIGVPGIFWFTAVLALAGVAVLWLVVPNPVTTRFHRDTEPVPGQFGRVMRDGQLLRLDFGVMTLHMALTATFVVFPVALRDAAGLGVNEHWMVYLPVMVLAMGAAVPFIIIAEKKRRMRELFLGAVALLALVELAMIPFHGSLSSIAILLWVFFTGFTFLEASLPSWLSKVAHADAKGTAMGVYSSSQFLGAFIGGAAGGWLYGLGGYTGVFAFCAALIGLWWLLALGLRQPPYLSSYMINVGPISAQQASLLERELAAVAGVAEAIVNADDGIAYLKIDRDRADDEALRRFAAASGA